MATVFRTRFAPSPTGLLHLGNVRTALYNWLLARGRGRFLLRIEDTDAMRGHERHTQALMEDLRWLGLDWQEGPAAGGPAGPYLQSERGAIYQTYFDRLYTSGQAYPCFCSEHELSVSRKTALAAGRPPRYSGKCRSLTPAEVQARFAAGMPATLRFHVADGQSVEFNDGVRGPQRFATDDIGDFIIRRSDGTPAFFFCNALDDALMGVTLVVRGEDHLTNTPRQILLLQALGLPVPEYAHIALVVGGDGAPLSKRTGSKSVQELREAGYLPGAVNNYLARLGHTYETNEFLDADGLAREFSAERLHKSPARYDEAHLNYWQHEALLKANTAELVSWLGADVIGIVPSGRLEVFIDVIRKNILFPPDALEWARIFFTDDLKISGGSRDLIEHAPPDYFSNVLGLFRSRPEDPNLFGRDVPVPAGSKRAIAFQLLRTALTYRHDGPEFAKIHAIMPKDRIIRRLDEAHRMSMKK